MSRGEWGSVVPADGRTGLHLVTLEVEAAPPAPGVAALRQRTALLARLRESGGARTTERKEQEAAIFRRDPEFLGPCDAGLWGTGSSRNDGRGDAQGQRPSASSPYPVRPRPYAEAQPPN